MVRDTLQVTDPEMDKKKTKYPRSIAFIISNEFCERFNYYGMRTILVLYLTQKLHYSDDDATVLYHIFTMFVYFFPLMGAVLADSWLGKFKTITYLSMVYSVGSAVIAIGAIPTLGLPASVMTVIGLMLIAIGTGGIKPCVSAFGGDQFKLPEQARHLETFFSLFYFAINAGSLISTSLTPVLREDVHCFGNNDCYSLAFGVPGALMIVSIIIFICGRVLYKVKKPEGNMIVLVSKCIGNAVATRLKEKKHNKREHWLDYAEATYGKQLIDDIKSVLRVLVLFLPLPVFWALFDQQGSRWTFQATRMTGDIGPYAIKPDQLQVVNPLLILGFIPLFSYAVYPMLAKCGIKRPLQKLTTGGILAAIAFLISGFVELELQKTYPVLPTANEGQLRIFNGIPCDYKVISNIPGHENFNILSKGLFEEKHLNLSVGDSFQFKVDFETADPICPRIVGAQVEIQRKKAISYFMQTNKVDPTVLDLVQYEDDPDKGSKGYPVVRVLSNTNKNQEVQFIEVAGDHTVYTFPSGKSNLTAVPPGHYVIRYNGDELKDVQLKLGGVYSFVVTENNLNQASIEEHVIAAPNSIHMLWLLPQYIVITAGEVMFSVTGLEFSFTQAPQSMKSVLQAAWLLTVAFGNLIVVIIAEAKAFDSQAAEFFLFAGLMAVDMGIFIILAIKYKYVEPKNEDETPSPAIDLPQKDSSTNGFKTIDLNNGKNSTNGVENTAFNED
ncbi:peptide transporter family 1-like isoform X2 [Culicoides brevitarsis]|uniref:peptide transporter family 1-like isoform X2 n=1 Tax=Culicoides brevitarsis TaxID=469753 RepID=UPI00307C80C1